MSLQKVKITSPNKYKKKSAFRAYDFSTGTTGRCPFGNETSGNTNYLPGTTVKIFNYYMIDKWAIRRDPTENTMHKPTGINHHYHNIFISNKILDDNIKTHSSFKITRY